MTSVDEALFLINHHFAPQQSKIQVPVKDALKLFLAEDILIPEQQIPTRNRTEKVNFTVVETLISRGTLLRPYEIGIFLKQGIEHVQVFKPVQVNVQPVYTDKYAYKPIVAPVIHNILRNFEGVHTVEEPMLTANKTDTLERIETLVNKSDIIFFTGYDLEWIAPIIEQKIGIKFIIKSIAQQPGGSLMIALNNNKAIFLLPPQQPGALLAAELYGRLTILQSIKRPLEIIKATSATEYNNKTQNTHFSIGRYSVFDKEIIVNFRQNVNELTLSDFINANCYVKVLPQTILSKGQTVEVIPFMIHN